MRQKRRRAVLVALYLTCALVPVSAQNDGSAERRDTIRITTRLVQVDVLVQDRDGRPIRGLKREDFTLFEDGKPQAIALFTAETRSRDTSPATSTAAVPPLDYVTNQPAPTTSTATIILLDLLNTSFRDRPFAVRAFNRFIEHDLRPGDSVAVFGLGRDLVLLQGFTRDPSLLRAAVRRYESNPRDPQHNRSGSDQLQGIADAIGPGALDLRSTLQALHTFHDEINEERLRHRIRVTMEALKTIAQAAQGHAGRKAMVWISGAFPLYFVSRNKTIVFEEEVKSATAALGDAQIAVYPTDVRGLIAVTPPPISSVAGIRRHPAMVSGQAAAIQAPIETMRRVAELTGGRAFYNRNDIENALAAAIDDGLSYYTLAYYPKNRNWNGVLRKLEVKVNARGAKVKHREGYLAAAMPDPEKDETAKREFEQALTSSPVQASQVLLHARLIPPSVAGDAYKAEFFLTGIQWNSSRRVIATH